MTRFRVIAAILLLTSSTACNSSLTAPEVASVRQVGPSAAMLDSVTGSINGGNDGTAENGASVGSAGGGTAGSGYDVDTPLAGDHEEPGSGAPPLSENGGTAGSGYNMLPR